MRILFWPQVLLATFVFAGCARKKASEPQYQSLTGASPATVSQTATPTPAPMLKALEGLTGKISSANPNLKFVVLTFPVGQMADVNQHLGVYRAGLKVGELNVTGPQRDDSIVADITAGEAQSGDEVRDR